VKATAARTIAMMIPLFSDNPANKIQITQTKHWKLNDLETINKKLKN
jgi:hypothetical protein